MQGVVRVDVMQPNEIFKRKAPRQPEERGLNIDSGYTNVYRIPGGKQAGRAVRKLGNCCQGKGEEEG